MALAWFLLWSQCIFQTASTIVRNSSLASKKYAITSMYAELWDAIQKSKKIWIKKRYNA